MAGVQSLLSPFISLSDTQYRNFTDLLLIIDALLAECDEKFPPFPRSRDTKDVLIGFLTRLTTLRLKTPTLQRLQRTIADAISEIEVLCQSCFFPGLYLFQDALRKLKECITDKLSGDFCHELTKQFDLCVVCATVKGQLEIILESHSFWTSKYGGEDKPSECVKSLRSNPNPFHTQENGNNEGANLNSGLNLFPSPAAQVQIPQIPAEVPSDLKPEMPSSSPDEASSVIVESDEIEGMNIIVLRYSVKIHCMRYLELQSAHWSGQSGSFWL